MSDDLNEVTANSPGGVAAWQTALEGIAWEDQSAVPVGFTADQREDLALNGKIGMMWREESDIKSVWRQEAPDIELEVIPLPKVEGTDGQPAVWTNVGFLFVAENSPHKEEAVELLRFLADQKVQEQYVIEGVDLMSPMKGVETPAEEVDPIVEKYLSYLPHGVGTQISVHWREATEALVQEAQAVMTGQKTAEQALADFEATVEPVLDGE